MGASEVSVEMIFLSQTMIGVLDNSYLLHHYLLFDFMGCRLMSTDWILMNFPVANIIPSLCKGVALTSLYNIGFKDACENFQETSPFNFLESLWICVHYLQTLLKFSFIIKLYQMLLKSYQGILTG